MIESLGGQLHVGRSGGGLGGSAGACFLPRVHQIEKEIFLFTLLLKLIVSECEWVRLAAVCGTYSGSGVPNVSNSKARGSWYVWDSNNTNIKEYRVRWWNVVWNSSCSGCQNWRKSMEVVRNAPRRDEYQTGTFLVTQQFFKSTSTWKLRWE